MSSKLEANDMRWVSDRNDADPLRFAVSKGLISFHCCTYPELFIQKDHNLGIDRDSSLKRWKPLRLLFHNCRGCHRRNPFSTLHRTTSREHWNVWQKYCVIVLLIYDFFSPFQSLSSQSRRKKNQKWWNDKIFRGRLFLVSFPPNKHSDF